MKRHGGMVVCALLSATISLAAGSNNDAAWVGQWNSELDGQPSVKLMLAEDGGHLDGTVLFNVIVKEDGQAHVAGGDTHVLMHLEFNGDTLSFQVVRKSDSKELHFAVKLESEGKAQLKCVNCGPDPVVAELVRER